MMGKSGQKHSRFVKTGLALSGVCLALAPARAEELSSFVESSLIHILFHEAGHAVIDQFGLPVIGQEEDAADAFATLEIANLFDEPAEILLDAAEAMIIMDEQSDDEMEFSDFYSEHDLDIQRGLRIVCHAVGLQPELFEEARTYFEMDSERRDICEADAALASDSWSVLIEPALLAEGDVPSDVRLSPAPATLGAAERAALFDSGLMEEFRSYLAGNFRWPEPVTVRVEDCGEANAFYDPADVSIILCAEMVRFLREIEGLR